MAGSTLLLAYPSGLVLQLKEPDSEIPIDISIESWIAAMPAVSGPLGSLIAAVSMARYGRKISQIASIIIMIVGWLVIDFAKGVTVIMISRFFHGLALGSSIYLTPIIIGEYTSPKHRGTFMMFTGFLSAFNVLVAHTAALYFHWRTNAIICNIIAVFNLPLALFSPESPSWLAATQRYDDCRRTFRWLRGDGEEEELENMIKANEISHKLNLENTKEKSEMTIRSKLVELKAVICKKAFYKPILVTIHVYSSGQWSGSHLLNTYVFDLIENIIGPGYSDQALGLNINRLVGSLLAVYIITKTKRKTMFLALSGANLAVLLATAAYTYAKSKDFLPYDFPYPGIVLMHLHMFFVTSCTLPLPYIIAGEIFPLKYKSIAGGFSIILVSLNTVLYTKTFPYLLYSIGIHGTYILYGGVILYCLIVSYFYLPETKDRTLLEIEEEITGKPVVQDKIEMIQPFIDKDAGN